MSEERAAHLRSVLKGYALPSVDNLRDLGDFRAFSIAGGLDVDVDSLMHRLRYGTELGGDNSLEDDVADAPPEQAENQLDEALLNFLSGSGDGGELGKTSFGLCLYLEQQKAEGNPLIATLDKKLKNVEAELKNVTGQHSQACGDLEKDEKQEKEKIDLPRTAKAT